MPTADAGRCFPAELLEQLKEQLPQALFATLSDRVATYEEQFGAASKQLDTTRSELQYARLKIQVLEEHLRLRRIAKYGPGSEKLSNLQLQLLEEEPGVSNQEVQAESEREALPAAGAARRSGSGARIPAGRRFSADLPRVEKVIACTAEQCVCGKCGAETKRDRLRRERSSEGQAGRVLRGSDQAREARLQAGARSRASPWRRFPRASSTRAWCPTR